MKTAKLIRVAALLALACGSVARAADSVTFTKKAQVGDKLTFATTVVGEMQITMTGGGQQMPPVQQSSKQTRQGTATIEAVDANGRPTKVTFVFSPDCGGEMTGPQGKQAVPATLAGKTVTVTKNAEKDLTFSAEVDQQAAIEITEMFRQDHTLMPEKTIAVGDSWDIPAADLQNFAPPGSGAETKGVGKLVGIETVNGRKVAKVEMTITMSGGNGPVKLDSTLTGTGRVDVISSQPLEMTIAGPMKATGQDMGPNGPVDISVNGKMTISGMSKRESVGRPVPDDGGDVVVPKPGVNIAGTYADPKITVMLVSGIAGWTGTIKMGDKEFPIKSANVSGPTVTGTFAVGDKAYDFTADVTADGMTFKTGSTTYNLKRAGGAPVDDNPLGGGGGGGAPNPLER